MRPVPKQTGSKVRQQPVAILLPTGRQQQKRRVGNEPAPWPDWSRTTLAPWPSVRKCAVLAPPHPGYIAEELAQVRMALRDMKAELRPAVELTAKDIRGMLSAAVGVTTARHRFGPLSRFLDWCQDAGHIPANPCALIAHARRPRAPQARAHYLRPPELARLWTAAGALREAVWCDLVRFLIAVPCRRNEAARLDWAHLDLAAAEWRQPGHMTKNRDPHRLHLPALALDVLRDRHRATGGRGLVFPAPSRAGQSTHSATSRPLWWARRSPRTTRTGRR